MYQLNLVVYLTYLTFVYLSFKHILFLILNQPSVI